MAILSFTVLGILAIVALVLVSAFFSSSETAIFTLSEQWIASQESTGDRRMQALQGLRADPHRLLVTLLVGNNVVNIAIASLTTVILIEHLPAKSAASVATVLASFVVLIFGEIVPKSYGLGHAEDWALTVSGPITAIERVLSPLVTFFDFITRKLNTLIGGEADIEKPYLDE